MSRNCQGNQCLSRKTITVIAKLLKSQCGQPWELKFLGELILERGHNIRFTSRSSTLVPTVNIRGKSPPTSSRKRGKEPFWNTRGHSILLNKACPWHKLVQQSFTCWVISDPNWLGEGTKPTPGHCTLLLHFCI